MSFNSLAFAAFMAVALAAYYAIPVRHRWWALLAASVAFYAASDPVHLPVLAALVAIAYVLGIAIERAGTRAARRALLAAGLAPLVVALAAFRGGAALGAGSAAGIAFLAAPLGLSFFTLRLAAYLVDVFRRAAPAERHAGRFSLFAALFPELPSGPIERPAALLPQLRQPHALRYDAVVSGAQLFAWGLFKKIVVADRLRLFVAPVFDTPGAFDGAAYAVATVLFAVQIYCDFSGYSDMAIGIGETFGLRLARNFDHPYQAKTISEFWARWHISFSTWLRDYIFLPLVYSTGRLLERHPGLRLPEEKTAYAAASLSTMALCGLWHGAAWTYLAWGLTMGGFMVASVLTRRLRSRIARRVYAGRLRAARDPVRTLLTFALVCVSWIFFRANSMGDAVRILAAIPRGIAGYAALAWSAVATGTLTGAGLSAPFRLGQGTFDLVLVVAGLLLLGAVERYERQGSVRDAVRARTAWIRWPLYIAFVLAIVIFRAPAGAGFIYAGF